MSDASSIRSIDPTPRSAEVAGRGTRIAAAVALLAAVLLVWAPTPAGATPATDGNPDLPQQCGMDMTLIIDRSGSIGNQNDEVADAANALISGLAGTGSEVQIISFSNRATALRDANNDGDTDDLADLEFVAAGSVTVPDFPSGGLTNWDDALEMARRSPAGIAPLTVVLTDGNPTTHNRGNPDGHGGTLGGGQGHLGSAIIEADLLKAAGTHLLAVGVGNGINTNNLSAVAGDEQLTVGGGISFAEADWTVVGFQELRRLLEDFVKELCAPSVNIVKVEVPQQGAPRPGNGWDFTLELGAVPGEWQSPAQAASNIDATLATAAGKANFKWENVDPTTPSTATVTEASQPGWELQSVTCTRRDYDDNTVSVIPVSVQTNADGDSSWVITDGIGPSDGINCAVVNRELAPARIDVAKQTLPAGIPGSFSFALRSGGATVGSASGVAHGDWRSFGEFVPGEYSVVEQAAPGFSVAGAACDDLGTQSMEQVPADGFEVDEGEHWLCTFVNEADEGSITIVKTAVEADGTFSFVSDFDGSFDLTTVDGTASSGPVDVAPGTYSVAEQVEAPWALTSASCSDGSPIGAIMVAPGEDVVCTFTNTAPDPTIEVIKTASVDAVDEPGATVTFDVEIRNTSVEPVTIDSVSDAVDGAAPFDVTTLPVTTCDAAVGVTLAPAGDPGDRITCSFDLWVGGDAGDVVDDVVTVTGHDDQGNEATDDDAAAVDIDDVDPTVVVTKGADPSEVDEPGAVVTYTASVRNTSVEDVTITAAVDSVDGGIPFDITSAVDPVLSTTCDDAIGTVLVPDASYGCEFELWVAGNAGDVVGDVVTFSVVDDDDNEASDTASASVDVVDVAPEVSVTKTADVDSVDEPGGDVTFAFLVENDSVESVTIDSLTDSVFGDLLGPDDCDLAGTVLAASDGTPGSGPDTATCSITRFVGGNAGDVHHNVVRVSVSDDDGNHATASDDETVDVVDVAPSIETVKGDGDAEVAAPGGVVTFTVDVTNTSVEPVTVVSISDVIDDGDPIDVTVVGDIVVATTCATGVEIPVGETYSCTFDAMINGDGSAPVADVVEVVVVDDDEHTATDDDDESTPVRPVSDLQLVKSLVTGEPIGPTGEAVFGLTVTNLGPSAAVGVVVTDDLPEGLTLLEAAGVGWDCTASTETSVRCTLPQLADGESSTITVATQVGEDVEVGVTNVASVESATPDPDLGNNTDAADVQITRVEAGVDAPEPADAPRRLAYTGGSMNVLALIGGALLVLGIGVGRGARRTDED